MNNLLLGFGGFEAGAGVIVAIGLSAAPSSNPAACEAQ